MKNIVFKFPSRVITEMLRQIPKRELEKLQRESKREIVSVPSAHLLKLTGITSIGGDALADTERVWE